MTDLIAQLRDTIPNYTRRRTDLDAVQAELTRRSKASNALNPFTTPGRVELEALLQAGDPLEQLDQRIAARLAAEQAAAGAHEALRQLETMLRAEVAAAEVSAQDVLPLLGAAMAERVTEAKQLAPLKEIATPEAAARSKRYGDADRLAEILGDIGALRREQLRVLQAGGFEWHKVSILQAFSNPAEVFPDTLVWLRPGYFVHRTDPGRQQQVVAPWPWPLMSALTSTEFSLWCIQNGAELWIPSPAEYAAAAATLRRAATEPRTDTGRHGDWVDAGPARDTTSSRTTSRGQARRPAHIAN